LFWEQIFKRPEKFSRRGICLPRLKLVFRLVNTAFRGIGILASRRLGLKLIRTHTPSSFHLGAAGGGGMQMARLDLFRICHIVFNSIYGIEQ
jgi:hypothetical protein